MVRSQTPWRSGSGAGGVPSTVLRPPSLTMRSAAGRMSELDTRPLRSSATTCRKAALGLGALKARHDVASALAHNVQRPWALVLRAGHQAEAPVRHHLAQRIQGSARALLAQRRLAQIRAGLKASSKPMQSSATTWLEISQAQNSTHVKPADGYFQHAESGQGKPVYLPMWLQEDPRLAGSKLRCHIC